MLIFSSAFPAIASSDAHDFFSAAVAWLSDCTSFNADELCTFFTQTEAKTQRGADSLHTLFCRTNGGEFAAIRHRHSSDTWQWITTAVFSTTHTQTAAGGAWVSVQQECEAQYPGAVPLALRHPHPLALGALLAAFGGATDGVLRVQSQPHLLDDTIDGIMQAAQLLCVSAQCSLPVMYASTQTWGGYALDLSHLARSVAGIAHVVVEPSRDFSRHLQRHLRKISMHTSWREIPERGAIGIYWPGSTDNHALFHAWKYSNSAHFEQTVRDALIFSQLSCRLPCTWEQVREAVAQKIIKSLEKEKSDSSRFDDYAREFDHEITLREQKIAEAEKEIQRLRGELLRYEADADARSEAGPGALLKAGNERDFYPNEILCMLLDAIRDSERAQPQDSRRQHVLRAILQANELEHNPIKDRRERIKKILRGMRNLDASLQRELEEMGFSITGEGKHFKLLFQGDDRYVYTLPKSGSDWRGGKNAAGDISRLLF